MSENQAQTKSRIDYPPATPFWTPLKSVVGQERCREFMFMGQVRLGVNLIFLYKHILTRNYINIDLNDNTYMYQSLNSIYFQIPMEEAKRHVFDR